MRYIRLRTCAESSNVPLVFPFETRVCLSVGSSLADFFVLLFGHMCTACAILACLSSFEDVAVNRCAVAEASRNSVAHETALNSYGWLMHLSLSVFPSITQATVS